MTPTRDVTSLAVPDVPEAEPGGLSRRLLLSGGLAIGGGALASVLFVDIAPAQAKSISDPKRRANGAVTIIGDSSVVFGLTGLKSELTKRNLGPFVCDARPARTLGVDHSGVSTAMEYIKANKIHPAVVVALGGGDTGIFKHSSKQIQDSLAQVIKALGQRQIGFSTQWSPRAKRYAQRYNDALFAAARKHGNVFVSDWAAKVKANPQWFGEDDAHYKTQGVKARNKFLADMALKAANRV